MFYVVAYHDGRAWFLSKLPAAGEPLALGVHALTCGGVGAEVAALPDETIATLAFAGLDDARAAAQAANDAAGYRFYALDAEVVSAGGDPFTTDALVQVHRPTADDDPQVIEDAAQQVADAMSDDDRDAAAGLDAPRVDDGEAD